MTAPTLRRETFSTPRAAEFFELRALQAQTGQPAHRFGEVIVKELVDNALDAAETAGADPSLRTLPGRLLIAYGRVNRSGERPA